MMLRFGVSPDEATELASAVARSWDEAERYPTAAFVLGHCWTGSVPLRVEPIL